MNTDKHDGFLQVLFKGALLAGFYVVNFTFKRVYGTEIRKSRLRLLVDAVDDELEDDGVTYYICRWAAESFARFLEYDNAYMQRFVKVWRRYNRYVQKNLNSNLTDTEPQEK